MKIKLQNVRLSFPHLFRRAVFNGEETKFGATFLLPKEGDDQADEIQKKIKGLIKTDLKGAKVAADKLCLRDGDDSDYDGYAGNWSIKASNGVRPLILNRDKSALAEEDGVIYPGCYVNAIIELWAQNNQWGKRINANLLGVQFVRDGDSFGDGGRVASADEFDEVPWEAGDDTPF